MQFMRALYKKSLERNLYNQERPSKAVKHIANYYLHHENVQLSKCKPTCISTLYVSQVIILFLGMCVQIKMKTTRYVSEIGDFSAAVCFLQP